MYIPSKTSRAASKYGSIPAGAKELYEAWLYVTSTTGLDLLPTGPTFKSFGKFHGGRHHISTLDQVYVSDTPGLFCCPTLSPTTFLFSRTYKSDDDVSVCISDLISI